MRIASAALIVVVGLAAGAAVAGCSRCGETPAKRPDPGQVVGPGPALQIVGDTVKVALDAPLPATSALFDGTTVTLRAARGETLGVQVLRAEAGEVPVPVALTLDVRSVTVRGARVEHQRVDRASTSMYGPSAGAGAYPDRLEDVAPGAPVPTTRAAIFDVVVGAEASPGVHQGTLTVGAQRIPVALRVEPVVLPPLTDHPRVWAYFDPREVADADGGTPGSPEELAAERRYVDLFRAHGAVLAPDLTPESWALRKDYLVGFPWVPVIIPDDDPAAVEASVRGWIERLAGSGQVPFAIPIDEPRSAERRALVGRLASAARRAGAGEGRFLYAVTHEPYADLGDAVDLYISFRAVTGPGPRPAPPPRVWTYNGHPPSAGAMILDTDGVALRTWGWIGWRYDIDVWYVWDALYWHDRHNHRRKTGRRELGPASDLTTGPITFDDGEDVGNLDGVLAYPGARSSLRLRALRRGLQDRLLLEQVAACAGRATADAIAARLVPTALGDTAAVRSAPGAWPIDEPPWEAARGELLDILVARCQS